MPACCCLRVRRWTRVLLHRHAAGLRETAIPPHTTHTHANKQPHTQATFAMLNWALRETVSQLAFGALAPPTPAAFAGVTYSLLALIYAVSILVPSGERGTGDHRVFSIPMRPIHQPTNPPTHPRTTLAHTRSVDRHLHHRRHRRRPPSFHPPWAAGAAHASRRGGADALAPRAGGGVRGAGGGHVGRVPGHDVRVAGAVKAGTGNAQPSTQSSRWSEPCQIVF